MSHRAHIYRVQVRPLREVNSWRLLGDFDEEGRWTGDLVVEALQGFQRSNVAETVWGEFEQSLPNLDADQVGATFRYGRSGVRAVISRQGDPDFDQTPGHRQNMRTAALFELPRNRNHGWLVVHVPEGRSGIKSLMHAAVKERFRRDGYLIEMNPVVPPSALGEAVERNAVESVRLIKRHRSGTDRFADAAQWGDDEVDRLELSVTSRKNKRLRGDPLRRFLGDPSAENRRRLYEFQGLRFDEVGVEVELPDGSHRTYYLEPQHPGGHPMAVGIRVERFDRYGPTAEILSRELRSALRSVVPTL